MIAEPELSFDDLAVDRLDPRQYAIDFFEPAYAVAPHDEASVASILARCDHAGAAVIFHGGGTLQSLGRAPERYTVAVSLARLDTVVAYEPRDLTISVGAGITVAALRRLLARDRLFVPLDVPDEARSTVGGALASGWLGPRRAAYGRPRDFVIGTTAALADGTLVHAGGMVAKNVTGYDVSKLYIGSLGTLGAIVRVNVKTLPRPERSRAAIAPVSDESYERALEAIGRLDVEPVAAFIIDGFAKDADATSRVLLLFEGTDATVDRATRQLRSALGAAGVASTTILDAGAQDALARVIDVAVETFGERSITYRSLGLVNDGPARAAACRDIARGFALECETLCDLRTGDVFARWSAPSPERLIESIAAVDAAVRAVAPRTIVVAGGSELRRAVDPWGTPPPSFGAMRELKSRFDPRRTLAPGRFVGGI